MAATVLAALSLGFYFWHGAGRVYALEDLPARLLEVKSIYANGWRYEHGDAKRAITVFAERPGRYWYTHYGVFGPDATHAEPRRSSGYVAGDGGEELHVFSSDRRAYVDPIPPIENELKTEHILQHEIPGDLLSGKSEDFAKTGSEIVGDAQCDVYERSLGLLKTRLWLNPKTGLPEKIAYYSVRQVRQGNPGLDIRSY